MKITVHNPNQIGGCITEIESKSGTRIIIDVGSNLPGIDESETTPVNIAKLTGRCDGVLITHYHGDHIGRYSEIAGDGKNVYMGKQAKEIFFIWQKQLADSDYIKEVTASDIEKIKNYNSVSQGDSFPIGDMEITPIRTDHSAFDSYMYLIEADGKRILHTGDFRTHGAVGKGTPKALEAIVAKKELHALICEGTMLSRPSENVISEFELQQKAALLMENKKYVFVLCSSTNIDRIAALYHANKSIDGGKRLFVHDDFQEKILRCVTSETKKYTSSKYYDFSESKNFNQSLFEEMEENGFCLLLRNSNLLRDGKAIKSGLAKLMYKFPDSLFIYSQWEEYAKGTIKGMDLSKAVPADYKYLHTSGHATEDELKDVCNLIKPGIIIPIHREKKSDFGKLGLPYPIKPLRSGQSCEV